MRAAWILPAALLLGACAPILPPGAIGEIDQVRETPAVTAAQKRVPAAYAKAEKLRAEAHAAFEADDLAGAQIIAEEALAAYEEAVVRARALNAEENRVGLAAKTEEARAELAKVEAELGAVEAELQAVETRLDVLQGLEAIVPSGRADPAREKARRRAVEALRLEARLLCTAGKLLTRSQNPSAEATQTLAEGEEALAALGKRDPAEPAPIDESRRARATCLRALTLVRRGGGGAALGTADALLLALSDASLGTPRRDDRGVVVTFRDLFDNGGLSAEGKKRLAAVAEVAKRHQAFPVMVVLHADARAERAEAVRTALADQLGAERVATPVMAGDALPMVNPQGKHASRNSRVEIIFVSPRAL